MSDLALAWEAREPDRIRGLLAAVGFGAASGGRLVVPGLVLAIVGTAGPDRLRLHATGDRPGAPGGGSATTGLDGAASVGLRAVGWATVDRDRQAAAFPSAAEALPDDELLGARAAASADPRVVLLEPATEGRLAATLARHGEGPAALYLETTAAAMVAIRDRLVRIGEPPRAGSGPFGPQLLATTRFAWGPHVLLVTPALTGDGRRGEAGAAAGTPPEL